MWSILAAAKSSMERISSYASDVMVHKTLPHVGGMAADAHGCMWVGYHDGRIEQYTADGRFLGKLAMLEPVRCLLAVSASVCVCGCVYV